jgi:hypothetical protein
MAARRLRRERSRRADEARGNSNPPAASRPPGEASRRSFVMIGGLDASDAERLVTLLTALRASIQNA